MISIIIVSFNSKNYIKSCLDSVYGQDYGDFEVIVVDNGSHDGTVTCIKENYPRVILIENNKNLGACEARNQGIEICRGDWVLTLDCDATLNNHFLSAAYQIIKNLPCETGIIQPKILKADKKTIYSKGIYLSFIRRFYDIEKGEADLQKPDISKYIFGACCAAAFYKKEMLQELKDDNGYFDKRFFFLVEDVDLSWRAKKKGWKTIYDARLVCLHSGNSSAFGRQARRYLCFRNRLLSIAKNENALGKLKLMPVFIIYDLMRLLFLSFVFRSTIGSIYYNITANDNRATTL
jgi:GT2 family glycosyltransferase